MATTNNRHETANGNGTAKNGLIPVTEHDPIYHGRPHYYGSAAYYGEGYGSAVDQDGIDLMKLVRIVLRRWKTVLLLAIIGTLGSILYTQKATPVYRAEAELEMSVRRPKIISTEAVYEERYLDSDTIINTRFAKFRSPAMEQLAVEEYLVRYPDSGADAAQLGDTVRRRVEWRKDKKSNIVRISMDSTDPLFAAQMVNVLSYCAGELMVKENQASSDGAVKWLGDQVEEKRAALEKVEEELTADRQTSQLDALRQSKVAQGESLNALTQEKTELESQLAIRNTIAEFIRELKDSKQDLETLPPGLPKEEELKELTSRWRAADEELKQMATLYTPQHPEYQNAKLVESRARERLDSFVTISFTAVQNEVLLLERQIGQLNRRIEGLKTSTVLLEQKLATGEQRLRRLDRKYEAADYAYQALLKRMEEARLSADETTAYTKVIRDAAVPRVPVYPRKGRAWAIGIMLGLLLGAGLAFLMEFWADEITRVGDLEGFGLNILGIIPSQKNVESRGDLAKIGLTDKFSLIFEIFAGVNALISSDKYRDRTKVMLICSVLPAEGKTIVACNLAISAALNESRTLLIDADLRRPRLAKIFGIDENHPSLLEWLSTGNDALDFDHLVSRGILDHLDVITSRQLHDINPAELLGRGRLAELISWAREHYDRVIIDSPPSGLVGDSQVLANCADSVIVVSRLGKTRRRALKYALGRFAELDTPVLGCIANDVPHSLAGMFGGGGGYGYGYGGYGGGYKSYGRMEADEPGE